MAHARQRRIRCRHLQQFIAHRHQRGVADTGVILQLQIKTRGAAHAGNRWRAAGDNAALFDVAEGFGGAFDNGERGAIRAGARLPVFQTHEQARHVLTVAARPRADSGEHRQHILFLLGHIVALDLRHHGGGLLQRRARRQLHLGQKDAAILKRQKRGGQTDKQKRHQADNREVEQQPASACAQNARDAALVAVGVAVEVAVKPAEKAAAAVMFSLRQRLQQRGAQGGRQDHRHQHRQHHRRDDGNGELTVDRADRAAEKSHRHENRRQHQRDPHQRALNLPHRLTRRRARREAFFAHNSLDVLHHHDGVVYQQADSKHHGEHGEGIDAEAAGVEHGKGAQQHHRHGDSGD